MDPYSTRIVNNNIKILEYQFNCIVVENILHFESF